MAADERWYFTKEQLANSPSRRCGIDADKELSYRQQAANFIQDMGQRLTVSQLCINTAIVYMHRFYVFHSLTQFHRNSIAAAALFLAAKVEEQPRKLEHVIKVAHICLHREAPMPDVKSDQYLDQAADLVFNENVLLQTLAFDVAIDHPHTHVVRCCHLVKASKDLAQTSYFMASNSLHLTTMCLQYKPTVVACFCIHLACKWSNWEIPISNEGKDWFWYVDKTVTWEQLSQLTAEFLHIFDKCPSRLRRKIRSISAGQSPNMPHPVNSPFESEPRKVQSPVNADGTTNFTSLRPFKSETSETDGNKAKPSTSSSSGRTTVGLDDYREKRERMEREKAAARASTSAMNAAAERHHSHHHKMGAASSNMPKHSSSSSSNARQNVHHNHHHNSRQDVKQPIMAQRHSSSTSSTSSSQSRDPNRDRQRMPGGYHASNSSHAPEDAPSLHNTSDSTTVHPPEKLSNNAPPNNRAADPRHGKQQQMKDAKAYGKYMDSRQARKPDLIEQKSEEVRKLMEKPLPPPKPRAEQIKEEYAAMMLKKSHQQPPKYGHQPEKPLPNSNSAAMADSSKMLNVSQNAFTVDKSPNAPVSASQVSHKSQMIPMKNGGTSATSSFSLGTLDDPKAEKRPRAHEQVEQPVKQHRSLFSPEKTLAPPAQQQQQRSKPKPKAAPEPTADMLAFSSSNSMPQSSSDLSQQQQQQRLANNAAQLKQQQLQQQQQQLRTTVDQDQRMQILEQHSRKFISSFSDTAMSANSRLPDLVKSMKDGRSSLPLLEAAKQPPPEMIKPLDDPIIPNQRYKQQQQQPQHHHGMSNGLDSSYSKQEYSTIDPSSFSIKNELPDQLLAHEEPVMPKLDNYMFHGSMTKSELLPNELDLSSSSSSSKRERFSPLKSAQSISALLQEPLAPMPSLLQQAQSYEQQQQQPPPPPAEVKVEPSLPSTVDMSELVAPIQCNVEVPAVKLEVPSSDDKKDKEHRSKSEKKKKKEKHRHKDKDKSKEKHKHKHKDKDKEKHRRDKSSKEKEKTDEGNGQASSATSGNSLGSLSAVPIKITIPKDKLNLSTESIGSSTAGSINSSAATSASNNGGGSSNSSLKIKIPKDRLKGAISPAQQQPMTAAGQLPSAQAAPPLKLKIRKETLDTQQQQQPPQQLQQQQQLDAVNRKRERSDEGSLPTAKKHQQQRPTERQNGRHSYPSNSTNKPDRFYEGVELLTDSGDVVEGFTRNFVPPSYGSSPPIYF